MRLFRLLTRHEKAQVRELRKIFTDMGHEVVSLRECFRRFGSEAMHRMPILPPLFRVGPRTFYCAKEMERAAREYFSEGIEE